MNDLKQYSGTLEIDGLKIPIQLDDIQVNQLFETPEPEMIDIRGETDDEFNSRRNSFFNWVCGLPKSRKKSTFIAGRAIFCEPLQVFIEEHLSVFETRGLKKCDAVLHINGVSSNINLLGMFVSEYSSDGYVTLHYDVKKYK